MSIYTFYFCNLGAGADSFEAFDLGSDDDAPARALQMLADHPTCAYVAVWSGERAVLERHREPPASTPPSDRTPHTDALEDPQ